MTLLVQTIFISPQQNGHFVAQQPGLSYIWLGWLMVTLSIVGLISAIRARFWPIWLLPWPPLLVAVLIFANHKPILYRMEITPHDALAYQHFEGGKMVGNANIYLENIASADIEYQRQDSRIVAVMRDGTKLYPMGDDWVEYEPLQFKVVNAIREAIGQIPAAPAPH